MYCMDYIHVNRHQGDDISMISSSWFLNIFGTYVAMPTNITNDFFEFPNDAARVSNKININSWITHVYSSPHKK